MNGVIPVVHLLNQEEEGQQVPRAIVRDRLDPLNVSDNELLRYYRFPRQIIIEFCDLLAPALERPTRRRNSLPVHTQVLIGLRFMASGSFQSVLGAVGGISQASSSRVLHKFCLSLVELAPRFVSFPHGNEEELTRIKQGKRQFICIPQ